jgi:hypothetical protein
MQVIKICKVFCLSFILFSILNGFALAADIDSLVVTENGNVGIGTASPVYKLTVYGQIGTADMNQPYLVLDSSGSGGQYTEQSAQISLGESGRGDAALHLAYTGDGYAYIGMGQLGSDNIPDYYAMRLYYRSHNIYFPGSIGIGTTNPQATLHVNGSVRGNQSGALRIDTGNGYLEIGPKNSSWAHFYTDRAKYYFDKEIRVESGLIGSYDEDLQLRTTGTTRMLIRNSNGNVGIGTKSPQSKLDVRGHAHIGGFSLTDPSGTPYPGNWIGMANNMGDGGKKWLHIGGITDSDGVRRSTYWADRHYFQGSVGIGTTSPKATLDVSGNGKVSGNLNVGGTISAKSLKLPPGPPSPDYVFEDSYALLSLEEVERFVKMNKHLPDIPSAKEMSENGIVVSSLLLDELKKVEELTLYMIELKKENESLKRRLAYLEQKIMAGDSQEDRVVPMD